MRRMWLDEFRRLQALISRARGPEDVFPSLSGAARGAGRRAALDEEYRRYTRIANPGPGVGNAETRNLAEELLVRLHRLYRGALARLDGGAGDIDVDIAVPAGGQDPDELPRAAPPDDVDPGRPYPFVEDTGEPEVVDTPTLELSFDVETREGRYRARGVIAVGDISTVYAGRALDGPHAGAQIVVKLARDPADNDLLLAEARTLRLFAQTGAPQLKQLPVLVDQFQTSDGRAANVLLRAPGFDLVAVRQRYREGVPPQHAVWILRRLLSVVGFAHSQGVLHGNIEPSHVVVNPADHNVVLLDWGYSLALPLSPGQGWKAYNPDYSAPEVAQKKPPIPPSDLYSVGRCAIMLLGGDLDTGQLPPSIDERMARFIEHFVRASPLGRAQDAWESFAQLKKLREEIYGPHKFLVFEM